MTTDVPQKILVIRLSSIGDILLTTPLLRHLRQRFQHADIDFIVKKQYADLLRTNPHLSHLLLFDQKSKHELSRMRAEILKNDYDLILDIHKNFRSIYLSGFLPHTKVIRYHKYYFKRFFLVHFGWNLYRQIIPVHQRYLQTISRWHIQDDGAGLDLVLDETEAGPIIERVTRFADGRSVIGMAPSAAFANKRWPLEYYAELGKKMQLHDNTCLVLIGDNRDRNITEQIAEQLPQQPLNLAGELSLMETAAAIHCLNLFVTNDTGPMHMASALKIPTLAIFGPTTRELGFFPLGRHSQVVENLDLSCRPCTHMGRNHCPKKHFRCMTDISPQQVYELSTTLLNKR
ncbi:glycosyltransferase family 9 protein [candidate division KSB1 bacterium]|nr:glycosyltransferase family 9 protein [candidate division KSB1 bacterium]